jgi:hypothetical protein
MSVLAAWGQGGNPSPSTEEGRVTSCYVITTLEQTAKDGGGSVEQQIRTLHEQSRQAAMKDDDSFFERYLADNFLGIGDDGRAITKDQYLQILKSDVFAETIDERDVKVRVYGDMAIVSVLASVTFNGKSIRGDRRATFVWVKQGGNWKQVSFQATFVASRPPRPGNNLGHDAPPSPP